MLQISTETPGVIDRLGIAALQTAGICTVSDDDVARLPEASSSRGRRELRGFWISPTGEHRWPSQPGLDANALRAELEELLDSAVRSHHNAVFVAIRSGSGVFWPSTLEPWAACLTGALDGDPGCDPMQLLVDESHARNLELHASFEPTLDAAIPAARSIDRAVVLEAVGRYDIDGVHMVDNFYRFSDTESEVSDVAEFVREVAEQLHTVKPWIKISASAFGIWDDESVHQLASAQSAHAESAPTSATVWSAWFDDVPSTPTSAANNDDSTAREQRTASTVATLVRAEPQGSMAEVREPAREFTQPALIPAMEHLPSSRLATPRIVSIERTDDGVTLQWRDRGGARFAATSFAIYRVSGDAAWINTATSEGLVATVRATGEHLEQWIDTEPPTGPVTYVVTALDRVWNQSAPSNKMQIE